MCKPSKISDVFFKIRSCSEIPSPKMRWMIAIIGEKVIVILRPREVHLSLLFIDCLEIIINCTKKEFELSTLYMMSIKICDIFKELVMNFCKLPCKVHSCCYHDMVCLKMTWYLLHTLDVCDRVCFYAFEHIIELILYLLSCCVASPLIHSARGIV